MFTFIPLKIKHLRNSNYLQCMHIKENNEFVYREKWILTIPKIENISFKN
jgi:hypothetical protein